MNEGASLNRLVDPAERVVELLAIKLFEHLNAGTPTVKLSWETLGEKGREPYRRIARGEDPIPGHMA